jgi:ribosome-associated protein
VLDDGSLLILARNHRTQEANRREAEGRLAALVEEALVEPKLRRATRPTLASKKRRIEGKVRRSGTKAGRGRVSFDD